MIKLSGGINVNVFISTLKKHFTSLSLSLSKKLSGDTMLVDLNRNPYKLKTIFYLTYSESTFKSYLPNNL